MRLPVAATLAFLAFAGCRTIDSGGTPSPAEESGDGSILLSPSGRSVSFPGLMERVRDSKVVYVGESHPNQHHHEFQLAVLKAMHAQDPKLALGMEMFQRPYQDAVDRFIAGKTDEATFLRETEYFSRWRWDWRYYRPLVLFAKKHGLPVIALNAPAEASRMVARKGLASLPPQIRKWVAKDVDLTITEHREFVEGIFAGHPMPPGMNLENFYAAQCLWEDTMAESVATALASRPDYRMMVAVGSGHVRRRFGIPDRADGRGAAPSTVMVGMDGAAEDPAEMLAENLGEVLYFTPASQARLSPRIGVRPDPAPGGLKAAKVTPGGLAELAGLRAGDVILAVGGMPVKDLADLQIALALLPSPQSTIDVLRGGEKLSLSFDSAWAVP